MTFTVQNHYRQIINLAVQRIGDRLEVFRRGRVQVNPAFGARTDSDFFHIHVRRVQQAAFGRNGNYRNRTGHPLGHKIRAFQRINRDIHFHTAGADLFTDVEHRRLVHFAFANDDRAANFHRIKRRPHRINRQLVSAILVASPHQAAAGDRRRFRHTDKFQG